MEMAASALEPIRASASRGPIEIQQGADQLVVTQKAAFWVRPLLYAWVVGLMVSVALSVAAFVGVPSSTLHCSRTTGTCTQTGTSLAPVPPLAEIADATLSTEFEKNVGSIHFVTLVLKDGTTRTLGASGAHGDEAIASARAAVKAVHAFLVDGGQAELETTWTVPASPWEKARTVFFVIGSVLALLYLRALSATHTLTVDRAQQRIITTRTGGGGSAQQQLSLGQVSSVVQREHSVELTLADGSTVPLVVASDLAMASGLTKALHELLGK